jgi:N-methylhydantoinase B
MDDGTRGLDPVTLAVLKGRLEQIVDEMDATLYRSSFNPIIAEAHDACHGIYEALTGDTLVQGTGGLPIFVGSMSFAVQAAIARAARDGGMRDGDVIVFNDPYQGGTHLNDMRLVRPLFRDGRLFCHLASVGHWTDVGGNVPGNYNPVARDSHQEGVLLPPVKLYDGGTVREDIVEILKTIGRSPINAVGDLTAQVAALDLGVRRLTDLLDEYGDAVVQRALTMLRTAGAQMMRSQIETLPDGSHPSEDFLVNNGIRDVPLRIAGEVTVTGSSLRLDFTGTAQACEGPVNIARSTTIAACYVALKHLFPEVPANAGCLDPIEFAIPPGCVLDAVSPRPVGGYTETILRIMDVIFDAVGQAAPERAMGASYGTINALSLTGQRGGGERWVMFTFFGGGLGGNVDGDGLNHGNAPLSTAVIPPVEVFEARFPVRFSRWSLRPDSGGPGLHRGGLGAVYEVEALVDDVDLSVFGERALTGPRGVAGGGSGAVNVITYDQDGVQRRPALASKVTGVRLQKGDRVRIESPGGGGYGSPMRRSAAAVRADVDSGYVTREMAARDYGVALDADGLVDEAASAELRRGAT